MGIVWELFWELLVIVWDEFGNGLGIVSELLEIVWELFGTAWSSRLHDCLEFSSARLVWSSRLHDCLEFSIAWLLEVLDCIAVWTSRMHDCLELSPARLSGVPFN